MCLVCAALLFGGGIYTGAKYFPDVRQEQLPGQTITKEIQVKGDAIHTVSNKIEYVPKEVIKYINAKGETVTAPEKTDLDANIGKTEFVVKVNGKETVFNKSEDEKYLFDKNKVKLDQTSKIDFSVTVPPIIIDNTKHIGIGIIGTNHGAAGELEYTNKHWGMSAIYGKDLKGGKFQLRF